MRLLPVFILFLLAVVSCSDQESRAPNATLILVEKWPELWKKEGLKSINRYPALKQLTDNGVVFTNAFTTSPEIDLAMQSLRSGMHTGHLSSDSFDKKNLDNFKNTLSARKYDLLGHADLSTLDGNDKIDPTVYVVRLKTNNLEELDQQVEKFLANNQSNSLVVLTALSGPGAAYSEESLRVPLIFCTADDQIKKGENKQAIYTADLFPSMADFLKIPYSTNSLDGQSFYKNIKRSTTPPDDRILYWKSTDKNNPEILRYNQWKMFRKNTTAEWQLFDMITDPEETDNVSAYHPGKFEKFQEWIAKND